MVRKFEKDFVKTVKSKKKTALIKKEKLKLEKNIKILDIFEKCKKYYGLIDA